MDTTEEFLEHDLAVDTQSSTSAGAGGLSTDAPPPEQTRGRGRPAGALTGSGKYPELKKLRIWHQSIVDWMLLNPGASQGDCARHFCVTESWLSIIMNTDAFKEFASIRIKEHQQRVTDSIVNQTQSVALKGMQKLGQRLEADVDNKLPISAIINTTELAMKSLGHGNRYGGGGVDQPVQPQFGNVNANVLANARAKLSLVVELNTRESQDNVGLYAKEVQEVEDAEELDIDLSFIDNLEVETFEREVFELERILALEGTSVKKLASSA